jgi:pyruvate dehydrogenase E1 component beta subunit
MRGNEALREALRQEMQRDHRVFAFGEDVARHGGVYRVTEGLLDRFGPQRVLDTPISESGMVGLAVGAALMGMRPVVEIQFTDLITIAMDQIANTAAKARFVHNGRMHAPLVVRTLNLGLGTVYASQAFEAWFTHVPGLKVFMASNPADAAGLLVSAIRDPDPVVFFEHRSLYGDRGEIPDVIEPLPIGRAKVMQEGSDVTLVAWSGMVSTAVQAAQQAEDEGISVEVIDPRTLAPFDAETVTDSVCKTGRLVIVHEAVRCTGFGAEVAAAIVNSRAFEYLLAPIVRVANPGVPVPHSAALHRYAIPVLDDVVKAIRKVIHYQ